MPRPPAEDLETFLQRQDLATLVSLLLELAEDHEAVRDRLVRLQLADRPDKLAAGFRNTLNGWRRSSKFVAGREAREFGRELEGWLDQVGRELMPKDPAAALLLEVDDDAGAEAVLLAEPARIDGDDYGSLVPLAKALHARELWRGETAVYRALLTAILDRAYARAYGHAARYWARLGEIAAMGIDLQPLAPHADFEAAVRAKHARKTSFWAHVKGKRRDDLDDGEE